MSFVPDHFSHDESRKAHQSIYGRQPSHISSWTDELVTGAAGFAALKDYEDHIRSTGEQVSHPLMKEMLASFASAEVDKLFETDGLDFLDKEEAKRRAVKQAHQLADKKYGTDGTFNEEQHHRHHYQEF